jgi:hypothetical protein
MRERRYHGEQAKSEPNRRLPILQIRCDMIRSGSEEVS